jgi:hypothetical protein
MEVNQRREGVIAIDNGGYSTGVVTSSLQKMFPSAKGEYVEMNMEPTLGQYDYIVELNGRKYLAGSIVQYECDYPLQMHTESKQNLFYDLSILIACHQFGYNTNYVMTCVPISFFTKEEKEGIINRLKGNWVLTVNNQTKSFTIADVKVAPETVTAFWNKKPEGLVRWMDWGSRDLNFGTTLNDGEKMRFINKDSDTFHGKGLEATPTKDYQMLSDFVAGRLLAKWNPKDKVIHVGGGARNQQIIDSFSKHFPNSEVHEQPQLAVAKGLYFLGKEIYDLA